MDRDADDIRHLIEDKLPGIYDSIQRGDTKDECQDFSEAILEVLLDHGEDAIMVQARTRDGEPLHHFLLWREGGSQDPVMIDPTVSQLYPDYKDVFIGTRQDLKEMVFEDGHDYGDFDHEEEAREIFKQYWRKNVHLYEPDGLYDGLGMPPPSKEDKTEFQEKWCDNNDFRVIQREKHTRDLDSGSRRQGDRGSRFF